MLILIFNSTAYCHAHSFTFYILFFISYIFHSSYLMFTSLVLVFSIFALSMERTRLSFHCWLYSLCIVVYVTNKTWNLKTWNLNKLFDNCFIYFTLSSDWIFNQQLDLTKWQNMPVLKFYASQCNGSCFELLGRTSFILIFQYWPFSHWVFLN